MSAKYDPSFPLLWRRILSRDSLTRPAVPSAQKENLKPSNLSLFYCGSCVLEKGRNKRDRDGRAALAE